MIPTEVTWFWEPFLAALDPKPDPDQLLAGATAIVDEQAHAAVDAPARANLWLTALAVAGYRHLRTTRGRDEAVAAFRAAFVDPFYAWVNVSTKEALDASDNPVEVLRSSSKEREATFFGATFSFDRPQDDDHGYIAVVRRCYYQQVLIAVGAPELLATFCDFDTAWMDAADPVRHGLRVERPSTFGYGGPSCWFVMTKIAEPVRG